MRKKQRNKKMKKIMIALVAFAVAAVAQAATVNWSVEGIQVNGNWDDAEGDLASGYAVYLFDNAGTYSQSQMAALIAADTWSPALAGSMASFVGGAESGGGSVNGLAAADGNFTGYMVIFNAATAAEATQAYVTGTYTKEDNSLHQIKFDTFDDESAWVNATGSWTAVNVPEPTSGLLLLLGMAGLALRRKQA
jgi:L-aminopeptidase/D-esterase-like protein